VLLLGLSLTACHDGRETVTAKPAKAEVIGHETELLKLTLTPSAEKRLGLATIPVGPGLATRSVTTHGEIVVAAVARGVPIDAQTDLRALAANQLRAEGEIARARAQLAVAQRSAARAAALVREEAGSVRARDEAQAAVAIAMADLRTAQAQRAILGASPSAIGRQGILWVRVAALAGDLGRINRAAPVQVRALGTPGAASVARPVAAPPSANATAGTVDLYYAIANSGADFRVGQRVEVELPAMGDSSGISVPASAVLHDIYGGEWVYVLTAPHVYQRRRIEIMSTSGGYSLVRRGVDRGDRVVIAGAAELFGTEFGAK
jgi:multidrug efflux pump subunit AcrA (membrane-fusion protein)